MVTESKQRIAGLAERWLRRGSYQVFDQSSPPWTRQSGAIGHQLSSGAHVLPSHMDSQSTELWDFGQTSSCAFVL